MAGGTVIGQGLVILASPVLTRLYGPADLGLFGIFASFIAFASVLLCLRYEAAIASAPTHREAALLTALSLALCAPSTLLAAAALWVLCRGDFLGFGQLPSWAIWIALPALFCTGVWTALRYHYVRGQALRRTAESGIIQNAGRAAIPIAAAPLHLGWLGLAAGEVIGRAASALWLLRRSGLSREHWRGVLSFAAASRLLAKYRQFPLYALPSSALNELALTLPVPLIAALYGSEAAGFFALVQRVLAVPASFVGRSVADAFHGQAAVYARESPHRVRPFLLGVAGRLALLSLAPALILFFFGSHLFSWAFGPTWATAGVLAAILAPRVFAQVVVSPVTPLVFVLGGQRAKLLYDLTATGVTVAALYGGWAWGLDLRGSVALLSAGYAIAYGLYFVILLRLASRATQGAS
jgi:O-antigen/teichoic acid export membrane protein